jgi:FKBP-type peptidyl-prolyl cis-trans isomerase FkpA
MRPVVFLLVMLGAGLPSGLALSAQTPSPNVPVQSAASSTLTDEQKTIYALGLMVQRSIRQFDLSPDEVAIVARALAEGAAGKPAVDLNEWGPRVDSLAGVRRDRVVAREKAASAVYLAAATEEIAAVRTPSGLVYRDLAVGTGPSPMTRDTVRVHYRGTLIDGTVFDSSYERKEPVAFRLGEVVPCWTEGVQRMKVGGRARLVCPSSLAYGDEGSPGTPGGAALIFEIELVGIIGPPAGRMRD